MVRRWAGEEGILQRLQERNDVMETNNVQTSGNKMSSGQEWVLDFKTKNLGKIALLFARCSPIKKPQETLLINTGSIHLKESGIHKKVKGFLLPCSSGVLISTQAAQQLHAGSITGGIMGTGRNATYVSKHSI